MIHSSQLEEGKFYPLTTNVAYRDKNYGMARATAYWQNGTLYAVLTWVGNAQGIEAPDYKLPMLLSDVDIAGHSPLALSHAWPLVLHPDTDAETLRLILGNRLEK